MMIVVLYSFVRITFIESECEFFSRVVEWHLLELELENNRGILCNIINPFDHKKLLTIK